MSVYSSFKTDKSAEVKGVFINYGDFRVKLARAGGSNDEYNLLLDRKSRAMRRTGAISAKRVEALSLELLIEACIKDWQVKIDGEWMQGINHPVTNEVVPFSAENVRAVLEAYEDLGRALMAEASSLEVFQEEQLKEEAGN